MNFIPHEVEVIGAYWPPILFAAVCGSIAMVVTARLAIRFGLNRYMVLPEVVMLALICIYTVLFGTFVFPL